MKYISAAMIVLSGSVLLLGGSFIGHDHTKLFVQTAGCGVVMFGMIGWFITLRNSAVPYEDRAL
jgi:hypothetical protein